MHSQVSDADELSMPPPPLLLLLLHSFQQFQQFQQHGGPSHPVCLLDRGAGAAVAPLHRCFCSQH